MLSLVTTTLDVLMHCGPTVKESVIHERVKPLPRERHANGLRRQACGCRSVHSIKAYSAPPGPSLGKLRLDIKNVSLKEVAADVVASVQNGLEQRRLQLIVAGLDKNIILAGDHVRLSQVITNLLSNSGRYTPVGGRILLSSACETGGKTVTIAVQDNGKGIAAEDLASVCNLFVQSRGGPKEANGGLGVGLAVVKRIVELHHGTLDMASTGPGKGTTITVRLPICCEPNPSTDCHTGIETAPSVKPVSILLVDDCEDALQSLSTVLALDGHSVETADSGAMAMRRLRSSKPDVAIMDICLPDADGVDVARAIRRDESAR